MQTCEQPVHSLRPKKFSQIFLRSKLSDGINLSVYNISVEQYAWWSSIPSLPCNSLGMAFWPTQTFWDGFVVCVVFSVLRRDIRFSQGFLSSRLSFLRPFALFTGLPSFPSPFSTIFHRPWGTWEIEVIPSPLIYNNLLLPASFGGVLRSKLLEKKEPLCWSISRLCCSWAQGAPPMVHGPSICRLVIRFEDLKCTCT